MTNAAAVIESNFKVAGVTNTQQREQEMAGVKADFEASCASHISSNIE